VAYASSFDTVGPLTHTVTDNALVLEALLGVDPRDATSRERPVPFDPAILRGDVRGLRVARLRGIVEEGLEPSLSAALDEAALTLRAAGAELSDLTLPSLTYATAAYCVMASAEASSNLARYDGSRFGRRAEGCESPDEVFRRSRSEGFGAEVKRRILLGTYVLSDGFREAYYEKARRARARILEELSEALSHVDLLLLPVAPTPPYPLGETRDDPARRFAEDLCCLPAALGGLPALALPFGRDSYGRPLSIQLMGRPFGEATLYEAGLVLEGSAK
jgi:aspartyl-tRNA(Asn)/glutamyl-tRNA(Gln) amidotransferase subunit A